MTEKKTWTTKQIKEKLQTSAKFVERSIVKLFESQPEEDKQFGSTNSEMNYFGAVAHFIAISTKPEGQRLERYELESCRNKLIKRHLTTITKIANDQ